MLDFFFATIIVRVEQYRAVSLRIQQSQCNNKKIAVRKTDLANF